MIFPKDEIIEKAHIKDYGRLYRQSIEHPEAFWENIARQLLWFKPWNKVLQWQYPYARWFLGGQTNLVYNALDRWQKTPIAEKLALIWVGQSEKETPNNFPVRTFTYKQLHKEVSRLANGLKTLGVKKGDRVIIYLPRIPQQFISMLACLKIGALHSVVYSGFSTEALKSRIEDAKAKVIITTDWYPYKDKILKPIENVTEAVKGIDSVEYVIVVEREKSETQNSKQEIIKQNNQDVIPCSPIRRTSSDQESIKLFNHIDSRFRQVRLGFRGNDNDINNPINKDGNSLQVSNLEFRNSNLNIKFLSYFNLVSKQDTLCPTAIMESTDPAFILYTSGSTGKPKGVVHSHGGYMVGVYATMKYVFDIHGDEIFWSTADAGWITGHSYILYGPLLNGITTFVYEGTPDFPDIEVWWKLIDRFKITHFYTSPTAIRTLMRFGEEPLKKYSLTSLRILGSVGEPINPKAWVWFYQNVGKNNFPPVLDTWWQTETGMHIITPFPAVPQKPGSCFKPFFGIVADVVDENGQSQPVDKQGYLVIKTPWPSMLLDLWGNPQRYKETYFEKLKTQNANVKTDFCYFTGDSAKIDDDGYFWITGRNDDVIKVSGHRLGSAEIEHAIVEHPSVAEAAVIGKPHEIKGESIKAFIILKIGETPSDELKKEINDLVRKQIGPIASIDEIEFTDKLPKTRSGKIMRRVLKAQELGLPVGDLSTLEG
jgi:acetyl-CoA synthetase